MQAEELAIQGNGEALALLDQGQEFAIQANWKGARNCSSAPDYFTKVSYTRNALTTILLRSASVTLNESRSSRLFRV